MRLMLIVTAVGILLLILVVAIKTTHNYVTKHSNARQNI